MTSVSNLNCTLFVTDHAMCDKLHVIVGKIQIDIDQRRQKH